MIDRDTIGHTLWIYTQLEHFNMDIVLRNCLRFGHIQSAKLILLEGVDLEDINNDRL